MIDGKIKLKNDTALEGFTETGLKFADGSELPADVVVFCTGYPLFDSEFQVAFLTKFSALEKLAM